MESQFKILIPLLISHQCTKCWQHWSEKFKENFQIISYPNCGNEYMAFIEVVNVEPKENKGEKENGGL